MMATLLLSQGVPMFVAGDEFGRSQGGNSNAYCHEISWIDWESIRPQDEAFREFVKRLIRLRREHNVFCRQRFFFSRTIKGTEITDIAWYRSDGQVLTPDDWSDGTNCLSFLVRGEAGEYHLTPRGEPQPDDSFFVILNAHFEGIDWTLHSISAGKRWRLLIDTESKDNNVASALHEDGDAYPAATRSLVVLVRHQD